MPHTSNRTNRLLCLILALVVGLPVAAAAADDLTLVSTVTAGRKGHTMTSTQYLSKDRLRTTDESSDTIVDYANKTFVFVDNKKKRYWKTTPEEINAQFEQLAQMLEGNPIMAKLFGKASEVKVTKSGNRRTIAGYKCDDYDITLGEAYRFSICAAESLEAPISYYAAMDMTYAMMGPMAGKMKAMLDELRKIHGMPLYSAFSMRMMGREIETITEVQEVRKGAIDPSTFDIPAGYKETKSPFSH